MSSTHFAIGVHILAALAFREGEVLPSEVLAESVNTNPAFIRHVLASLRTAGLVTSQLGKGGGSTLTRSPTEIRLDEVYRATQTQPTVALARSKPNENCPIGKKIKPFISKVIDQGEEAMLDVLHRVTIADVVTELQD